MSKVYTRGRRLYVDYRDASGARVQQATGFAVGQEEQAAALLAALERKVAAARDVASADEGPITLRLYAKRWIERRRGRVRSLGDEQSRLRLHILPRLGSMLLADVRPRHVRDLVLDLRQEGKLAPRSIRTIFGLLHTLFRSAVTDELVAANPCVVDAGILPKKLDKDPTWRATAIYSRDEAERLISDERILTDRRVLYALKLLTGVRHGEAAGLRWERYDATAAPLGRLTIAASYGRDSTKTGQPREVPVHPTLAAILAAWKLSGWAATYGRPPSPGDLIVPTRGSRVKKGEERRLGIRNKKDAQDALDRDLDTLELRHRRGHDMRRTFISLARTDGARRDLLEVVTHGARGDIMSMYSTYTWEALCAEVVKLRLDVRRGELIALPTPAELSQRSRASLVTVPATTEKTEQKTVTPPGIEGGQAVHASPSVPRESARLALVSGTNGVQCALDCNSAVTVALADPFPVGEHVTAALADALSRWIGRQNAQQLRQALISILAKLG